MDIHSKPSLVTYSVNALLSLGLVQWLLLPEVGLPDIEDPLYAMTFARIFHVTGAYIFGNAALCYYQHKPKVFRKDHYGVFLVACTLQHVGSQALHEFVGVGTVTDIWNVNQMMTTYGVAVLVLHCLSHNGPIALFRRLAHQPAPVFVAMIASLVLTLICCVSGWILGTYPAGSLGSSFFGRVGAYFVAVALFGFLFVQYILYQQALAALEKKID